MFSNPRNWRFTWEAQSHTPTLKLFLFNGYTNPSVRCNSTLSVQLTPLQSHLLVTWLEPQQNDDADTQVSLKVPIPRVLIVPEPPVRFRALDDHIEVKLSLLLPVDHPIVSTFNPISDAVKPLVMDSDLKYLSSREEVDFYCRSCSGRLTKSPVRNFVEMPSVNWQEVADNWFGACCCSFGGISEKLVNRYARAYTCAKGVCMLSTTAVTLCKEDLVGYKISELNGETEDRKPDFYCDNGLSGESLPEFRMNHGRVAWCESESERVYRVNCKLRHLDLNSESLEENVHKIVIEEDTKCGKLSCVVSTSYDSENVAPSPGYCDSACCAGDGIDEVRTLDVSKRALEDQKTTKYMELMDNQISFLHGFLGNAFMARSYNLSADIEWKQYVCPQCSSLLGAYPCANGDVPVDAGVRFFKCYISTSPLVGGPGDLFRNYTLERMFANQLVESARDELSFRTVVKDLATKSPILQIVLLNPNSWCCSGNCLDNNSAMELPSKLDLQPVIKVLFSDCRHSTDAESRMVEDWITKNQADEVFMLRHLVEELIESMTSAKDVLPPCCAFLHSLSLSSIQSSNAQFGLSCDVGRYC